MEVVQISLKAEKHQLLNIVRFKRFLSFRVRGEKREREDRRREEGEKETGEVKERMIREEKEERGGEDRDRQMLISMRCVCTMERQCKNTVKALKLHRGTKQKYIMLFVWINIKMTKIWHF